MDIDAPKFIMLICPNCSTEYRIPVEYCGKDAVCSNPACGVMFEIPSFEELMKPEEIVEPDAPQEEISTSTVKIDRRGMIGMKPDPAKLKTGVDTSDFVVMKTERQEKQKRVFKVPRRI